ncbi:MAG: TAXI family TRAP transporter solute-binding subunit [Chloroflexota bacterium]
MAMVVSGVGTANNALALAWGAVLENQTGMDVRIVAEDSALVRHKLQKAGVTDITLAEFTSAKDGLEGVNGYETIDGGPFEMTIFWNSNIAPWGLPVKGNSPIKTIFDLKGAKIATLPQSPFIHTGVLSFLAAAGLTEADVTLIPMSNYSSAARAIIEGKADTFFLSPISSVTHEIAATPGGIRWLALPTKAENPDAVAGYLSVNPIAFFAPCPSGVESAIGVNMELQPQTYMSGPGADQELLYNVAKWLDEHFNDYKDASPTANLLKIDNFVNFVVSNSFVPIAPGVVKYLKEKNLWTAEFEARQQANIVKVKAYIDAYQAAIKMASDQKVSVNPSNEDWVKLWTDYKNQKGLEPFHP